MAKVKIYEKIPNHWEQFLKRGIFCNRLTITPDNALDFDMCLLFCDAIIVCFNLLFNDLTSIIVDC